MQISLDDTIWQRLYGPYGVEDVTTDLRQLSDRWESAIAEDLFWEKLHHQGDLYPVTYAALPWLWKAARCQKCPEFALFCAHVLYCANGEREGPGGGRYRGLSLNVHDHLNAFSERAEKLDASDMATLTHLEHWFAETSPSIAQMCAEAMPKDDPNTAAQLAKGVAAFCGSAPLAEALEFWSGEQDVDYVLDAVIEEEHDLSKVRKTLAIVGNRNESVRQVIEIMNEFWSLED